MVDTLLDYNFEDGDLRFRVSIQSLERSVAIIVAVKIAAEVAFVEVLRVDLWKRSRVFLRQQPKVMTRYGEIEALAQRLLLEKKFIENFPDVREAFWAWRSKTPLLSTT